MEFANESNVDSLHYNCSTNINFYNTYPNGSVSLEQFKKLAIERLRILRVFEEVSAKTAGKSRAEFNKQLEISMKNKRINNWRTLVFGVEQSTDSAKIEREREKDLVSHFILRLAFSKSEHVRRWFISNELDLFRYRIYALSYDSQSFNIFLNSNDVGYHSIPANSHDKVIEMIPEEVRQAFFSNAARIYLVPFEDASDLVSKRAVVVRNGTAFLSQFQLIPTICSRFRTNLSLSLASLSHVNLFDEDDRIVPILEELSMDYLENTEMPTKGAIIRASQVNQISHQFPLCMRIMHEFVKEHHHLRHWGRMQYGLFLKSIGLPLEESLKFWKDEFTKGMEPDKFDRNYSYSIRHNYGQEGKRTSYTPYSCMRIISSAGPSVGDCHGCPFKHFDMESLKVELSKRVVGTSVDRILEKTKAQHYQVSCGMFLAAEIGMDDLVDFIPNQPSDYYKEYIDKKCKK